RYRSLPLVTTAPGSWELGPRLGVCGRGCPPVAGVAAPHVQLLRPTFARCRGARYRRQRTTPSPSPSSEPRRRRRTSHEDAFTGGNSRQATTVGLALALASSI